MSLSFANRVKSYSEHFSATEHKIADYLLENAGNACLMSIQELATACDTSISTLSRFSKKIGCQNYQELRMLLSSADQVNAQTFFKTVNRSDSLLSIATGHFSSCMCSLSQTQKALSEETLQAAAKILKNSRSCGLFGFGGSAVVTFNMYHRFIRTSLPCLLAQDFHIQLMTAAKMTPNDCAVVVSHTGKNIDVLRIVKLLRENGVPIIAITSNPASKLVKESTVSFISVSEETEYRPEAMNSLVSQMAIVDALYIIYSLKIQTDNGYFSKIRQVINETREHPKK